MHDRIKLKIALVVGASFALSGIYDNILHSFNLHQDHDHDVGFGAPTVQTRKNPNISNRALQSATQETEYINHTKIMEEREERLKKEWAFEILDESVPNQQEICYISCAYGNDVKKLDRLVKLTNKSPHVKFYLYTNLNDEQWKTPGWKKVITNFTYRRRITHSRYGKFLGWKNEEIQKNCDAVFYVDSSIRPRLDLQTMNDIALSLHNTKYGFYQHVHKRSKSGIIREFGVIQLFKKDIDENINASIAWMETQPDYDPRSPLFLNQCMAYLPGSKMFQKVSSAFWERYSQELDSWRDQPLWAFMLHRYNITPDIFPQNHSELWEIPHPKKFGHNRHMYFSEDDVRMFDKPPPAPVVQPKVESESSDDDEDD